MYMVYVCGHEAIGIQNEYNVTCGVLSIICIHRYTMRLTSYRNLKYVGLCYGDCGYTHVRLCGGQFCELSVIRIA